MAQQTAADGQARSEPLTADQIHRLSDAIGAGEVDGNRDTLVEKIMDRVAVEDVQTVDVDLGGARIEVLTGSLRFRGRVDDVSGQIRSVTVETRDGRLLVESAPPETLGEMVAVQDEIEAAKERRRNHIPPRKYR